MYPDGGQIMSTLSLPTLKHLVTEPSASLHWCSITLYSIPALGMYSITAYSIPTLKQSAGCAVDVVMAHDSQLCHTTNFLLCSLASRADFQVLQDAL